jgi:hypothetical protein
MGPKLLFLVGIVVTHAAVGAALMTQEPEAPVVAVSSCIYAPEPPAPFQAQAEILAMRVSTVTSLETLQP